MKLHKYGMIFSIVYFVYSRSILIWIFFFKPDPKGEYVLMQLALIPALLLFISARVDKLVEALPWLNNYPVFYIFNLLIAYLLGSAIEFATKKVKYRRMAAYIENRKNLRAARKRRNDLS